MKILGVSGSLRNGSRHTALLHALKERSHPEVLFRIASPLDALPHFNPDHDQEGTTHESVLLWRKELSSSDAVVFAVPEYAHALPGCFKNALDWIVASGELVHKPVGVLNASPNHLGARHAHRALLYTLRLLSAYPVEGAALNLAGIGGKVDKRGTILDSETDLAIRRFLQALRDGARIAGEKQM